MHEIIVPNQTSASLSHREKQGKNHDDMLQNPLFAMLSSVQFRSYIPDFPPLPTKTYTHRHIHHDIYHTVSFPAAEKGKGKANCALPPTGSPTEKENEVKIPPPKKDKRKQD